MEKVKILSSFEEIKVISDSYRVKVLFLFDDDQTPLTVKQMATKLEEVPSKVYYHVKELERIGVLEIVETREKAGIIEKYYLPTAETFHIEKRIGADENEVKQQLQVGETFFEAIRQEFIKSNRRKKPEDKGYISYGQHQLTEDEADELQQMISSFFKNKNKREGTKPYGFGSFLFEIYDKGSAE